MSTKKAKYKHVYCTDCIHFNADIYPEKIPTMCVFCYPYDVPDSKSTELRIKYKEKITSTVKNYLYKLLKRITVHGR
jgi:hypothetical protein